MILKVLLFVKNKIDGFLIYDIYFLLKTFRRLLLNKCQDEFENRSRATEVFDKDGPLTADEAEQLHLAKHKMLGNIKFIGEFEIQHFCS